MEGEGQRAAAVHDVGRASSDQIRSLYHDSDGVLWIATFGGGLNALHEGKFFHYGAKDGLLSDNIGKVFDDGNRCG